MRGLAGVVALNGRRVDPAHAAELRTAHAARSELSMLEDGDAPVRIAADIRLDEREELAALFDPAPGTDDALLALAAYERWGPSFVDRLYGDFALAILDTTTSRLLLARDHLGTRPLAFARTGSYVAFGSDPAALALLDEVDQAVDEVAMLAVVLDSTLVERTQFRGVQRVRPGHMVEIDLGSGTARTRRWWSPDLTQLHLGSDEEYAGLFRTTFERAVRNRLPGSGPVGTDLSGGLDSSSVTAVAAELLGGDAVISVGTDFSDPRWNGGSLDEGAFRRAVAATTGVALYELPAADAIPRGSADRMMAAQGGPYAGLLLQMAAARYRAAVDRGASVMLDGYDGDSAVNLGFQRLIRLAITGRLTTLHRELSALASHGGASYRRAVYQGMWLSTGDWLRWMLGRDPIPRGVVNDDLLERTGLASMLRAERPPLPGSPAREALFHLQAGWLGTGFEGWDRAGLSAGVEVRHPFADRRLVELCLRLPPEQHMNHGWTRWVMRRALADLLPDSMTWRSRKGSLPSDFVIAYANAFPVSQVVMHGPGRASPYVEPAGFAEVVARWNSGPRAAEAFSLLAVAAVDRWLADEM